MQTTFQMMDPIAWIDGYRVLLNPPQAGEIASHPLQLPGSLIPVGGKRSAIPKTKRLRALPIKREKNKPPNCFILFRSFFQNLVDSSHQKFTSKFLGDVWKIMTPKDKQPWVDAATKAKEEFEALRKGKKGKKERKSEKKVASSAGNPDQGDMHGTPESSTTVGDVASSDYGKGNLGVDDIVDAQKFAFNDFHPQDFQFLFQKALLLSGATTEFLVGGSDYMQQPDRNEPMETIMLPGHQNMVTMPVTPFFHTTYLPEVNPNVLDDPLWSYSAGVHGFQPQIPVITNSDDFAMFGVDTSCFCWNTGV